MIRILSPKKLGIYFSFALFLLLSCNDNNTDTKPTTPAADTGKKAETPTVPPATTAALSGYLDNLYILSTDFNKLSGKQNVVFSFYFAPGDKITLRGWQCKNNAIGNCTGKYNANPDISLTNAIATTEPYGPDTYLGNIILAEKSVKNIKDNFSNKYTYVVFVPKRIGASIEYSIFVTNDDPTKAVKALVLDPTFEDANPSPPKNYN